MRRNLLRSLLLLLCVCLVLTTVFAEEVCDHDYALVAYQPPRHRADGFERYRCTKCGDEYENPLDRLPEPPVNWSYDSLSNATSSTLTIFAGYYGMDYQQKIVLSVNDIINNCEMVTQSFSYINRRPRVCYSVGYGPRLLDVLDYAGVDCGSIQAFQFGTADSGGNFYNQEEWTYSSLYRSRYFFPDLSVYFQQDGEFSDSGAAEEGLEWVEPMLAIWSTWRTYDIGEEFCLGDHSASMSAQNCFRLLYGQSWIGEASANTSAKWCNAIFVRYAGAPSVSAGEDLNLSVEKDKNGYQLRASVSAADSQLTERFSDAVSWSSSDESVVRVNSKTGKITVVGEGKAIITATTTVGGMTVSDSITVTVSKDKENTGGGTGDGSGKGDGTGTGDGKGDGKGDGSGDTRPGDGSGSGEKPVNKPGNKPNKPGTAISVLPSAPSGVTAPEKEPDGSASGQLTTREPEKITHGALRRIQTAGTPGADAAPGSAGSTSGGSTGGAALLLTDSRTLLLTALAALALLLLGGLLKYLQYRKELK